MPTAHKSPPLVLFAGGGTGGHIFPSLAIAEYFANSESQPDSLFVCSSRPIDTRILRHAKVDFLSIPMQPLPRKRIALPLFLFNYIRSRLRASRILRNPDIRCIVSVGGFIAVPIVQLAKKRDIPIFLLNLDAVPGKANRLLLDQADRIFSVYPIDPPADIPFSVIPFPLRRQAIGPDDRSAARAELGFDPDRPLLLVTGASLGAQSINHLMAHIIEDAAFRAAVADWQIFHLAGSSQTSELQDAYLSHRLDATVSPFTDEMGLAWAAADLAISRAGAGSVAEIVANAVPSILLPYPHHADHHQMLNADPLLEAGGSLLFDDLVDPIANAVNIRQPLIDLLGSLERRQAMSEALHSIYRGNGAHTIAQAVLELLDVSPPARMSQTPVTAAT